MGVNLLSKQFFSECNVTLWLIGIIPEEWKYKIKKKNCKSILNKIFKNKFYDENFMTYEGFDLEKV